MTEKVIEFPKHKVVRDVPDEVIEERNRRADQKMADSIVDELSGILITELDNYNVDVQDKVFAKDFILVIDSIKAAVYRSFGLDHTFHEFIDNNVTLIDADMGSLTKEEIQDKIDAVMADLIAAREDLDKETE